MKYLKKYVYAAFTLLLHGTTTQASPAISYAYDNLENNASPDTGTLFSEKSNVTQEGNAPYCLTPSDPGCNNMWQKGNDERRVLYQQKNVVTRISGPA